MLVVLQVLEAIPFRVAGTGFMPFAVLVLPYRVRGDKRAGVGS